VHAELQGLGDSVLSRAFRPCGGAGDDRITPRGQHLDRVAWGNGHVVGNRRDARRDTLEGDAPNPVALESGIGAASTVWRMPLMVTPPSAARVAALIPVNTKCRRLTLVRLMMS
jgi:hypothetical protein